MRNRVSFEAKPTRAATEFTKFWKQFVKEQLSDGDSCLGQLDPEYIARSAFKAGLQLGIDAFHDTKIMKELVGDGN